MTGKFVRIFLYAGCANYRFVVSFWGGGVHAIAFGRLRCFAPHLAEQLGISIRLGKRFAKLDL